MKCSRVCVSLFKKAHSPLPIVFWKTFFVRPSLIKTWNEPLELYANDPVCFWFGKSFNKLNDCPNEKKSVFPLNPVHAYPAYSVANETRNTSARQNLSLVSCGILGYIVSPQASNRVRKGLLLLLLHFSPRRKWRVNTKCYSRRSDIERGLFWKAKIFLSIV